MKTGNLLLPHWRKKMFRRRKNEGAFDDALSTPTQTKVIESKPVNYEGNVRGRKHSVEEVKPDLRGTLPVSKSTTTDPYPLPDGEIDIYAVDLRIWTRVKNYIDGLGGGGGGGPHTHDGLYAPTDHEHELEDHTHDTTHTHDDFAGKQEFDDLKAEVDQHLTNHPEGGETPDPDPDPPSLTMTYTHRFELGKDGALWDTGSDGGQQNAVLPKVDADGKEFAPERSLGDIRVALDEKGEQTADWDNVTTSDSGETIFVSYTRYYFQDQPQDELFFDIGWALRPGGNRGLMEIQEELDQLKKLVVKHSHTYNGKMTDEG